MTERQWSKRSFYDVAKIKGGLVDPRSSEFCDYLHVGPENIDGQTGTIIEPLETASEIGLISGKFTFKKGDILYSKIRPNLNKVARAICDGLCSADMYVIEPASSEIHIDFLYHALRGEAFYKQAVASSMRSGLPKVNREDLGLITLNVPSVDEQRRIAQVLNYWDKAMIAAERLISAKEQRLAAIADGYMAPCFRDTPPNGWKKFRLGELFSERDEHTPHDPLLSITADRGVVHRDEVERKDTSSDDKSAYKSIRIGDIGYNTMRMWQGVSAISSLNGIVSPAYTIVTPNSHIDGNFAAFLFKQRRMVYEFKRYSQGLVDDTLSLKFPHFAEVAVALPDLAEQQHIAGVIGAAKADIAGLRQVSNLFRRQKRGLMQQLLSDEQRSIGNTDGAVTEGSNSSRSGLAVS